MLSKLTVRWEVPETVVSCSSLRINRAKGSQVVKRKKKGANIAQYMAEGIGLYAPNHCKAEGL